MRIYMERTGKFIHRFEQRAINKAIYTGMRHASHEHSIIFFSLCVVRFCF